MFDDILDKKKKDKKHTSQSIIEALKDNVKEKEELINDLIKEISSLKKELEQYKK